MSNIPPFQQLDPRVQRTMDLLYSAFVGILRTKHYKYVKVQDITKAAGINRATFYNHFGKMDDFIIYCAREGFRRETIQKFPPTQFEFSLENLHSLIKWVFEFMAREYNLWHFQWDELMFEKAMRVEFYYYLTAWIPNHDAHPEQPNFGDTTALWISTSVVGIGMAWCENDCPEPVNDLTGRTVELIWPGLAGLVDQRR